MQLSLGVVLIKMIMRTKGLDKWLTNQQKYLLHCTLTMHTMLTHTRPASSAWGTWKRSLGSWKETVKCSCISTLNIQWIYGVSQAVIPFFQEGCFQIEQFLKTTLQVSCMLLESVCPSKQPEISHYVIKPFHSFIIASTVFACINISLFLNRSTKWSLSSSEGLKHLQHSRNHVF